MEPIVRVAEPADATAVAALIAQLGFTASAGEVAGRLERLCEPPGAVWVAQLADRTVGCLTTSIMHVLHRPAAVGRISMLVVDEAMRGQGIGARLVQAAEAGLRAQGCYMVEVTSRDDRVRAHAFYERLGYQKTSVRLARTL